MFNLGRLCFWRKSGIVAGGNVVGRDLIVIGDRQGKKQNQSDSSCAIPEKNGRHDTIILFADDDRRDVFRAHGAAVCRVFDMARQNVFGGYFEGEVVLNGAKIAVRVFNRRS